MHAIQFCNIQNTEPKTILKQRLYNYHKRKNRRGGVYLTIGNVYFLSNLAKILKLWKFNLLMFNVIQFVEDDFIHAVVGEKPWLRPH